MTTDKRDQAARFFDNIEEDFILEEEKKQEPQAEAPAINTEEA